MLPSLPDVLMMDRLRRIGLILIVVFGVLWSFSLVDSYIAGELSMERLILRLMASKTSWDATPYSPLATMVVVLILALYFYKARIERGRTIERKFLEIRAINVWHPIILFFLTLIVVPMTYYIFFLSGLDKITIMMWIPYGLFVFLFLFFIVHVIIGKIEIGAEGLWASSALGYFSWDDFEKAKLKWNGKLLILGRDDVYILLQPSKFIKAIETFKPKPSKKRQNEGFLPRE